MRNFSWRNIEKTWVEETIRRPDATERKEIDAFISGVLPGRHVMLRVVTALHDPDYGITAYFDRKRPCT
jgi:hypothetical protein